MGRFVRKRLLSGGKRFPTELVDALGRREVLETVVAEIG